MPVPGASTPTRSAAGALVSFIVGAALADAAGADAVVLAALATGGGGIAVSPAVLEHPPTHANMPRSVIAR